MILDRYMACRGLLAAIMFVAAAMTTSLAPAQEIVAVIDGEPITAVDIEQRSKFTQLVTHKVPSRHEEVDELRNEKLIVREAREAGLAVTEAEIGDAYTMMSARMGLKPALLTAALVRAGVDVGTLRHRIRADITRQKYRSQGATVSPGYAPTSDAPRVKSLWSPPRRLHMTRLDRLRPQADVGERALADA